MMLFFYMWIRWIKEKIWVKAGLLGNCLKVLKLSIDMLHAFISVALVLALVSIEHLGKKIELAISI